MKMTELEVLLIGTPPPHAGSDVWYTIRVHTDEGITGLGEAMPHRVFYRMLRSFKQYIGDVFEQWFKGEDPFERERLFIRAYNSLCAQHSDIIGLCMLSAIEMAMWDICGKALGRPVCDLLGGKCRDELPAYSYISFDETGDGKCQKTHTGLWKNYSQLWGDPKATAERAAEMVDAGFKALKYDPMEYRVSAEGVTPVKPYTLTWQDMKVTVDTLEAIRNAVGDRIEILIGTHGQFTTEGAIRFAKLVEPYRPMWIEEPIPPENVEEMAKVKRSTHIPIASGERLTTVYDAARAIESDAVSILQPDIGTCGGFIQAMKMAAVAEAHYVEVAPHLWGGAVLSAAVAQFSASIPNFLITECILKADHFFTEITESFLSWENSCIRLPDAPGLGITLNDKALKPYLLDV